MAEILKKDDFKRVELLNLVTKKGGMRNLSLEQLILLDELLKKKDYSNQEKAEKSKKPTGGRMRFNNLLFGFFWAGFQLSR